MKRGEFFGISNLYGENDVPMKATALGNTVLILMTQKGIEKQLGGSVRMTLLRNVHY